jgi:hypothetical protein
METLISATGLYTGLMIGLYVLWRYEVLSYRATIAAACFLAFGYVWFVALTTAPELAVAQSVDEAVVPKSDSLLSPMNIRRLFSQQQADEALEIENAVAGLFNQFTPPLPRSRPRGNPLMWHWCDPQHRLVTAEDWKNCRGKTAISPLLTQPFPPLPTKG